MPTEISRPQIHFTPPSGWMNDPNGLIYLDGEYHLFYQHNPFGIDWGNISWGHAVSRDLVHWEHLPVAIPMSDAVMAFSGSTVIDWHNSSGFSDGDPPPLVAIYTGFHMETKIQDQRLAYSLNDGRTWQLYAGNPILDFQKADFRDPKVFWYEDLSHWVMVVALSIERIIQFYCSTDLKTWKLLSNFSLPTIGTGVWECPDLFPLKTAADNKKWVLIISVGSGMIGGGSGVQYFVGDFDGRCFHADSTSPQFLDFGPEH